MMVSIDEPKSAIIVVKNNGLQITHGDVDDRDSNFHDELVWEQDYKAGLIRVSGIRIKKVYIDERFTERIGDLFDETNTIKIDGKKYTFDAFLECIIEEDLKNNRTRGGMEIVKKTKSLDLGYIPINTILRRLKFIGTKYRYIHNGRDFTFSGINITLKKSMWTKTEYVTNNFVMQKI